MKRRKWLNVTISQQHNWGAVSGADAYRLLAALESRPLWSARSRAWVTSAGKASDLLALADLRGYLVTYTNADADELPLAGDAG